MRKTLIPKNINKMSREELMSLAIEIDEEVYRLENKLDAILRGMKDLIHRVSR